MKLDEFHRHEVLDRGHVVREIWGEYVLDHPVVQNDPELLEVAQRAFEAVCEFYQTCGRKFL